MNNEELKKKILSIVRGAMLEADELPFIETTDNIADALIAAGVGGTSDLEVKCEVLQRDVDNLTRTMEEGAEELKEAEHCAKVLGRTLAIMKGKGLISGVVDDYIKQAEKELAEDIKNGELE